MKGFAFGQYYPAESVLHRMDPRAKVICAVAYIVASFLCKNTFSFILLLFSAFALILISRIPMKDLGKPEDIAEAVRFLASDRAKYITGQVLCVDGGMAI